MSTRRQWLYRGLLAWNIGWALYFTLTSTAPSGKHRAEDISGRYVLLKSDGSGWSTGKMGYPFIAYDGVGDGAEIAVTQGSDHSVTFAYQFTNGYHMTNSILLSRKCNYRWTDGSLTYFKRKTALCGILPGFGVLVEDSRITRNSHGDLEIRYLQTEKVITLFLVPFWESVQTSLVLRRISGGSERGLSVGRSMSDEMRMKYRSSGGGTPMLCPPTNATPSFYRLGELNVEASRSNHELLRHPPDGLWSEALPAQTVRVEVIDALPNQSAIGQTLIDDTRQPDR